MHQNQKIDNYLKNIGLIKQKMNQKFKDKQQEPFIISDEIIICVHIKI